MAEMTVGIRKIIVCDGTRDLGPTATDLGQGIFEPADHIDPDAVFLARYGI